MRIQHKVIFTILTVVLLFGTLFPQNNSSKVDNLNIERPVASNTGQEMGEFDFQSTENWFPKTTIQDVVRKSLISGQGQYDLSRHGTDDLQKPNTHEIIPDQFVDPVVVAFDATHATSTSVFELQNDLTMLGVEFIIIEGEFIIPDGVNVLLLAGSGLDYAPEEVDQIFNWYYNLGPRLLWVAGDSDFGGFYNSNSSNWVLEFLGSNLRIAADAVADDVNNDDASYRVAVPSPACEGEYSCTFTEGVGSAIFHGPTSVLGYSGGNIVDLNTNPLLGIEVVMRASSDAYALDQDFSGTEFDYYSTSALLGDYPMMAIQDMGDNKFVITTGEAIFSDNFDMYSMETSQGLQGNPKAWNGGFQEGKLLVDNVLTWFGVNREVMFDEPIYIFGNEDFVNQGFPGSGIPEDPFVLEGLSLTNPNDNLINIFDTDAYFVIRDNVLNGLDSWVTGISLYNVKNGAIDNNFISGTSQAINLDFSRDISIFNNFIEFNGGGVNLWESRDNSIDSNTITDNEWAGISLGNEQPIVWMRFYEDITSTERDSIVWQVSFEDLDEGLVRYYHDNLQVLLSLDGEPVSVDFLEVYFDDGTGLWRFDMEYFSEPLPLGEHEFETHFFLDGEEIVSGFGHVTVLPNAVVNIRFFEDATITIGDQIAWQASYVDPDIVLLEEALLISETLLYVNGELVEVGYSDIYFDEEIGQFRFNIDYLTDPLDLGEYLFAVQFLENGLEVYSEFAIVTVLPISVNDNNLISNNFISNNAQGIWIDNSNSNLVIDNILEGNWGDAVATWQSHRNTFSSNTIQTNAGQGINIGGDDNMIANNLVRWNSFGIQLAGGSNNVVENNEVYQNWELGIGINQIWHSQIIGNVIYENGGGISISESFANQIQSNDIFLNWGDGLSLYNSGDNLISDNTIDQNGGAGIWASVDMTAYMRFNEDITATDLQNIFWQATSQSDNLDYLQLEHDNLFVELIVDGEPVDVEITDIRLDEGDGFFKYDINYFSGPLLVGEHLFSVMFVVEGESGFVFEASALVTVIPGELLIDGSSINQNFLGNNGWVGIGMENIYLAFIESNEVVGNGGQGIWIGQSTQIEVTKNVVWSNWADAGINLYMTSDSIISGNEIFEHFSNAILLELSSNNQILSNQLYNNNAGVVLFGSTENTISLNMIYDSTFGIGLFTNSNQNVISYNIVHDLSDDGIGGWNSHGNLLAFNEIYNVDDGIIFRFSNENVMVDNYIHDNRNRGIFLTTESFGPVLMRFNEDITVNDINSILWQATSESGDQEYLQFEHDNIVVELTVDGEPVEVELTDIWYDEGDGQYKYDINYFTGPLSLGEHFFDVKFSIVGIFEFEASAIVTVILDDITSTGNVISDNTIADSENTGIHLFGSDNNVISRNDITRSGNGGIAIIQSDGNLIMRNWSNENGLSGVFLSLSNNNFIIRNTLNSNGFSGIYLTQSNENFIAKNRISGSVSGGIELHGSHNNIIVKNKSKDNGLSGIFLEGSSNNKISRNKLQNNLFDGITLHTGSDNNFVRSNDIENNNGGIVILFSTGNTIIRNDVENGFYGIGLNTSTENTISRNELENNYYGIVLGQSDGNIIRNNEVEENEYGIVLSESHNNNITHNEIEENIYGLALSYSNNNEISRNEIEDNGVGIILIFSFYNTFSLNEFEDNDTDWIVID